ncbi:MAG: hypothetical protein ABSA97_15555 [Verrucomicrobiia bacterium]|jgi:hypothetical protein
MAGISEDAAAVLHKMGNGMRLLIARQSPQQCSLVNDARFDPTPREETANLTVVWELIRKGVISELTEFGQNERIGWRDAGFDGEHYHVYVCTQ